MQSGVLHSVGRGSAETLAAVASAPSRAAPPEEEARRTPLEPLVVAALQDNGTFTMAGAKADAVSTGSAQAAAEGGAVNTPPVPISKARALSLLTELIAGYSTRRFQQKLQALVDMAQEDHSGKEKECGRPSLQGSKPGREELALLVQQEVLPKYGFSGNSHGVWDMSRAMQSMLNDPEVLAKVEQMHQLLELKEKAPQHQEVFGLAPRQETLVATNTPSVAAPQAPQGSAASGAAADPAEDAADPVHEIAAALQASSHALELVHDTEVAPVSSALPTWPHAAEEGGFAAPSSFVDAEPPALELGKAEASALLADLIIGFGSPCFQKELQVLVDKAIARGSQDLRHVRGRRNLALTVQRKILPRHGFDGSKQGVEQMSQAMVPLLEDPSILAKVEAVHLKLRIPKTPPKRESGDCLVAPTSSDDKTLPIGKRAFTKARAVALQIELLEGYRDPAFQSTLKELQARCRMDGQPHSTALRDLVRAMQANILPRYGFEATDNGVRTMIAAVDAMRSDPDIYVLSTAIDEALCSPVEGETVKAPQSKCSKKNLLDLLRELIIGFSSPKFQAEVAALKARALQHAAQDDFYLLPGREELALRVQHDILLGHGFEGNTQGVKRLEAECARHVLDPDVARLVHAINKKLGMSAAACRSYVRALSTTVLEGGNGSVTNDCDVDRFTRPRSRNFEDIFPAEKGLGTTPVPAAADIPTTDSIAVEPGSVESNTAEVKSVPVLTKTRALTLLTELMTVLTSKGLDRKLQKLLKLEAPRKLTSGVERLVHAVQAEVLPKYGFEANETGIGLMWQAVEPLLGDPTVAMRAHAVHQKLQTLSNKLSDTIKGAPDRRGAAAQIGEEREPETVEEYDREDLDSSKTLAIALFNELLTSFSAPALQKKLNETHRAHNIHSLEYAKALGELARSVQAEIMPKYGFSASPDGFEALYLKLSPLFSDPDIQVLQSALDEALYGSDLGVKGPVRSRSSAGKLTLRSAKALLREHLARFGTSQFQRKLGALRRASRAGDGDDGFCLEGRAELTLTEQEDILARYGFECNRGGVLSMVAQCAQYISDPEVAGLYDAINMQLGMRPDACARFRQSLTRVQHEWGAPKSVAQRTAGIVVC